MEVVLTIMVVAGIAGAIVASNKRRSAFGWFLLCFLIPLCLIIILVLQPLKEESPKSGATEADHTKTLKKNVVHNRPFQTHMLNQSEVVRLSTLTMILGGRHW
jgi:Na+/melibiose symporter-like transporter